MKVDLVTNLLKSESKSKFSKNGLNYGLECKSALKSKVDLRVTTSNTNKFVIALKK